MAFANVFSNILSNCIPHGRPQSFRYGGGRSHAQRGDQHDGQLTLRKGEERSCFLLRRVIYGSSSGCIQRFSSSGRPFSVPTHLKSVPESCYLALYIRGYINTFIQNSAKGNRVYSTHEYIFHFNIIHEFKQLNDQFRVLFLNCSVTQYIYG